MRTSPDGSATVDGDEKLPRIGVLSRKTIDWAIEKLQRQYGLADPDVGFAALQKASQKHNVKLRSVAAALVATNETAARRRARRPDRPPLSFSERSAAAQPNRTHVLQDLLTSVTAITGAECGAVQLCDPVHGGLVIEGQHGFEREFLNFFGYVDHAGTACGTTLQRRTQTFVADVETSAIYAHEDRHVVLTAGVRSVLSTPLRDQTDGVRGAVTVHFASPRRAPTAAVAERVQIQADECARWLRWYDATTMPRVLSSVHAAARAATSGSGARQDTPPTPTPASLRTVPLPSAR